MTIRAMAFFGSDLATRVRVRFYAADIDLARRLVTPEELDADQALFVRLATGDRA